MLADAGLFSSWVVAAAGDTGGCFENVVPNPEYIGDRNLSHGLGLRVLLSEGFGVTEVWYSCGSWCRGHPAMKDSEEEARVSAGCDRRPLISSVSLPRLHRGKQDWFGALP